MSTKVERHGDILLNKVVNIGKTKEWQGLFEVFNDNDNL